jgi:hypothetical protein
MTVFLYLNDVEEGGGTYFKDLDITVQPKTGRAVVWPSVRDEFPDRKDPRTSHEALPVKKGIKYGGEKYIAMLFLPACKNNVRPRYYGNTKSPLILFIFSASHYLIITFKPTHGFISAHSKKYSRKVVPNANIYIIEEKRTQRTLLWFLVVVQLRIRVTTVI